MVSGPTPLHFVEAPCNGAGKTLLCDLVSLVTTGKSMNAQTLPQSDDEAAKVITAELLNGRPLILLDNQSEKKKLNNTALASALTIEYWSGRLLGQSKMLTLPNRAVWLMTGNNPHMTTEMARRCIRIRIDPKRDRAWQRDPEQFRHPDLKDWVKEHRGEIIHAIHVLVRAWLAAGKPYARRAIGSFESWAKVIGGILGVAGVLGFLECLNEMYRQADTDGEEWNAFVNAWWEEFADKPCKVSDLNMLCEQRNLLATVRGDKTMRSQEIRLGLSLNAMRDRVFGKLRLTAVDSAKYNKGGRMYALIMEDDDSDDSLKQPEQTNLSECETPENLPSGQCGCCGSADVVRMFETQHPHSPNNLETKDLKFSADVCGCLPATRVRARDYIYIQRIEDDHARACESAVETSANIRSENGRSTNDVVPTPCESADVSSSSKNNIRTTSAVAKHPQSAIPDDRGEAWEDPKYVEPTFPDGSRIPNPWDPDYDPAKDPYYNPDEDDES
jgi:hypothetical protein